MNEKFKYRFIAGLGYPIIDLKEIATDDEKKYKDIFAAIKMPKTHPKDLFGFFGRYVQSGPNTNLAWFSRKELIKAYETIAYKALDVEHDLTQVCGTLWNAAFVNRKTNEILNIKDLKETSDDKLKKIDIDVITGNLLFSDRFPSMKDRVRLKTVAISMETWYESFKLKVGDLLLTLEEADALGLSQFVEKLFNPFESEESMIKAHTLTTIAADNSKKDIIVYKYLENLHFSGAGLVDNPACERCMVLSSDKSPEEELKQAASKIGPSEFTLDLRKHEPYMKAWQEDNKIVIDNIDPSCECQDDLETAAPAVPAPHELPPSPTDSPPDSHPDYRPINYDDLQTRPGECLQYKEKVWKQEYDAEGNFQGDAVELTEWCVRNHVKCPTAGDSSDHACVRWSKTQNGNWIFDPDDNQAETQDGWEYFDKASLETFIKEELIRMKSKEDSKFEALIHEYKASILGLEFTEQAAVWTTQYINGLPNSSFAVVEKGYKAGESPKGARHLPYKGSDGKVDLPHLRNALARMNQIKSVLGTESDSALRARAKAKLTPIAKRYLPNSNIGNE